jgi:rubredoxin
MKDGLKARMRRVAESRQCPSCKRKQALAKVEKLCPEEPQIYSCRHCGHEFTRGDT